MWNQIAQYMLPCTGLDINMYPTVTLENLQNSSPTLRLKLKNQQSLLQMTGISLFFFVPPRKYEYRLKIMINGFADIYCRKWNNLSCGVVAQFNNEKHRHKTHFWVFRLILTSEWLSSGLVVCRNKQWEFPVTDQPVTLIKDGSFLSTDLLLCLIYGNARTSK